MKRRASYERAVLWIALNDEPLLADDGDVEEVSWQLTVVLTADLWNRTPKTVARDVIEERQRQEGR